MDINELHKNAISGNNRDKDILFSELKARFRLILRHKLMDLEECEEIAQDALMTIAEKFDKMTFEVSFVAWAKKVLDNKLIDYYRSKNAGLSKLERVNDYAIPVSNKGIDPILKERLKDCLEQLNRQNRYHGRILVLKYLGFSFEEINRRLKLSASNAYSVLSRARAKLKQCLEKKDK